MGANYSDAQYEAKGAKVVDRATVLSADIIIGLHPPAIRDLARGTAVACVADPFRHPDRIREALKAGITLLSLDMIPRRLSRAQAMDVNSSQDSLSGYKAALLGAANMAKAVPMMTTSAGTVRPAKFVVMGSGVAGLQAIATAKRLGAVVYASDVRLAAKEQVESVGGRFIEVDGMEDFEDESGYAKPLTREFIQKVNDTVCGVARDADVIITTARIFGRPAPITVPTAALEGFRDGAVVVDMNADVGGNCESTQAGSTVVVDHVTIIGIERLASTLPTTASMLYSNNLTHFVTTLVQDGKLHIDLEDDILVGAPEGSPFHVKGMGGVLICQGGAIHEKQTRLQEMLQ